MTSHKFTIGLTITMGVLLGVGASFQAKAMNLKQWKAPILFLAPTAIMPKQ